jgi:hypothetical protein
VGVASLFLVAAACEAADSTDSTPSAPSISTSADPVMSTTVPATEVTGPIIAGEPAGSVPAASAASCVEVYSPANLVKRAFAFDGTVLSVRDEVDPRLPEEEGPVPRAEFEVNDWFGQPDGPAVVVVWMQRPVRVGERLLVSGEPRWGGESLDDAIAWECGFTVPFSETLAGEWAAAIDAAASTASTRGDADAACRAWVPEGYEFFNAAPATVGEIRGFRGGPANNRLWPDAFPGSDPATFAAWCRGFDGGLGYVTYVASPGLSAIVLGHEDGIVEPGPPGSPRIE